MLNVPKGALGFAVIRNVELLDELTGFGVKLALTFDGRPLTLSVTELLLPTGVRLTVMAPLLLRLTVSEDGDKAIVKSVDAGVTVTVTVVVCVRTPDVPWTTTL